MFIVMYLYNLLLNFRLGLGIFEVALNAVAARWIYRGDFQCTNEKITVYIIEGNILNYLTTFSRLLKSNLHVNFAPILGCFLYS